MTLHHSNNRADDRQRGSFIRWSASPCRCPKANPDPGFVVDRQRLYKYLDSLEGFSGE